MERPRMTMTAARLDQLAIDTIRTLAIDGVQRANSGPPGAPMGMAPLAYAARDRAPGGARPPGPLGQGIANAVGMAVAARRLAGEFNRPGHTIVDHRTYVICSDGDLQEGVSAEAASLAGHLRLGELIVLYDDNRIQLDGPTSMAWSEDVLARFDAYAWHTQRVDDGNDVEAVAAAVTAAQADPRPSLTAGRTHIGHGAPPKRDPQNGHGAPLGPDEVRL